MTVCLFTGKKIRQQTFPSHYEKGMIMAVVPRVDI